MEKAEQGFHHDGRIDAVAGTGIISELGMGDEKFGPNDVNGNGKKTASNLVGKTAEKTGEVIEKGEKSGHRPNACVSLVSSLRTLDDDCMSRGILRHQRYALRSK